MENNSAVSKAPNTEPDEVDPEVPSPEVSNDKVDEASWESFPASDAPGWRDDD